MMGLSLLAGAFCVIPAWGEEASGEAVNEKIRAEIEQSESTLASASEVINKQWESAYQVAAVSQLDVLKAQNATLEARLGSLSLINLVGVNGPPHPRFVEERRKLAAEIQANYESQLSILNARFAHASESSEELLQVELKLYLFLLSRHELIGLDERALNAKARKLMEKLITLDKEKSKAGI